MLSRTRMVQYQGCNICLLLSRPIHWILRRLQAQDNNYVNCGRILSFLDVGTRISERECWNYVSEAYAEFFSEFSHIRACWWGGWAPVFDKSIHNFEKFTAVTLIGVVLFHEFLSCLHLLITLCVHFVLGIYVHGVWFFRHVYSFPIGGVCLQVI